MSDLASPVRFILSIEESLTLLAWEKSFTAEDFMAADGVENYRRMLAYAESKFRETEIRYTEAERQPDSSSEGTKPDARNALEILASTAEQPFGVLGPPPVRQDKQFLHFSLGTYANDIAHYKASLAYAERVIPALEHASGGYTYGSPAFFSDLSRAQEILWEAIKGGTVTAHAKIDRSDSDWQAIPPRWFWHNPPPTSDLGRSSIERKGGPTGIQAQWLDVRFERPQIVALRSSPSLQERSEQPSELKRPIPANALRKHLEGIRRSSESIPAADELYPRIVARFPEYRVTREAVRSVHETVWGKQPRGPRKKSAE